MANKRKTYSPNETMLLYSEVDGVCPLCAKSLIYEKRGRKQKNFEIAHVYPLNPKPSEVIELAGETKLNLDPNHLDNVICLCTGCHNKFDKPRTKEEYRQLKKIKENLIQKHKEKEIWNDYSLENDIVRILETLRDDDTTMDYDDDILNYDPKTIDLKTNDTIQRISVIKIKAFVNDYYVFIKKKFKELDREKPMSTEIISHQVKTYYLKMAQQYTNQDDIYNAVSNWINVKSGKVSINASEVITSYFIQNCEVFE